MIDPPAAAHVASSTSDGIACTVDWIHGWGGMPNHAEHGVEDAVRVGAVEELPQQHGDDRRDHDGQVRERGVEALAALAPRSSAPP